MSELLKVGDKLYYKKHQRFSDYIYYEFTTVERLTKTRAVLANGTVLVNEPKQYGGKFGFGIYGDTWEKYYHVTSEIIEEARLERKRQQIARWFNDKKFTDEEKEIIYLKLNETK